VVRQLQGAFTVTCRGNGFLLMTFSWKHDSGIDILSSSLSEEFRRVSVSTPYRSRDVRITDLKNQREEHHQLACRRRWRDYKEPIDGSQ
jgi:hypothetical protein